MSKLSKIEYLYKEITKAIKNPSLISQILNKKYWDILRVNFKVGKSWSAFNNNSKFMIRSYNNYEDYLAHQQTKLHYIALINTERQGLLDYDVKYRELLRERLKTLDIAWPGKSALCLAARLGTEVKAFLDLGCFAVGIDINPGDNNPYVLYGDFHKLQFTAESVDIIFCNSLDHVYDIDKVLSEIKRVLQQDGIVILELQKGKEEGRGPGFYESFWWAKIDDVVSLLEDQQLQLRNRFPIDYPWEGELLCFVK
ncbi:MAG: class I SAM-dependent methyltransferase [Desulfobacteraceae bacterium]